MILFVTLGIVRSNHAGPVRIRDGVPIFLELFDLQRGRVTRRRTNQPSAPRRAAKVVGDVVLSNVGVGRPGRAVRIGEDRLESGGPRDRFRRCWQVGDVGGPQEGNRQGQDARRCSDWFGSSRHLGSPYAANTTVAVSETAGSALLAARTVTIVTPGGTCAGAVYRPLSSTVPQFLLSTVHVTA